MRRFPLGELKLREGHLKDNLGQARTIFVGSSCDMWAEQVPNGWIERVLHHCWKFPEVTFLFQSKNPARFVDFEFAPNTILGTTIESNRDMRDISRAPSPYDRMQAMARLPGRKMVSIEPIMDFDTGRLASWMWCIRPEFISIGADSKGHGLPEPSATKLRALIGKLEGHAEVKQKSNLKRLMA